MAASPQLATARCSTARSNVIGTGAVTVNGATAVLDLATFTDSVGTVTLDGGGLITGTALSALTSTAPSR